MRSLAKNLVQTQEKAKCIVCPQSAESINAVVSSFNTESKDFWSLCAEPRAFYNDTVSPTISLTNWLLSKGPFSLYRAV